MSPWVKFAMAAAGVLVAAVLAFGATSATAERARDTAQAARRQAVANTAAIAALSERMARSEERQRAIKEQLDRIEALVRRLK